MKKLILLWLTLAMYCISNAQVVTIKDKETAQPLELVTLISEEPKAFATTNAKGQADISKFSGIEKIEIRLLGYSPITKSYAEIEANNFIVELEIFGVQMDEVIVSGTRWSQSTKDLTAKVTSINAKNVALQNPQTAADLLGTSDEVFIQKSQQGGGSPMIRGFATNRLLYTVDGIRMNTAIFRAGNIQNVISLDPFATENTEVLFGPSSVIYGSDAIGGVMSFKTLSPQLSLTEGEELITGKAITRYSSANNEKTAHFDINIGWKKWAIVSSISSNNYDNLKMGTHGPKEYLRPFYVQQQNGFDAIITNEDPLIQNPSGYTQLNMMQKLRFKPNEKWDIEYGFHYSETSNYSRYDRHIRYKNGLPRYGEWYYGPQIWLMNNLNITNKSENFLYDQMTVRLAQQYFEESRVSRDINKSDRENRVEKVDAYSVNIDFNKNIGKKNELFYGLEAVQNEVNSIGTNDDISTGETVEGPARYPQSTWASYAAYLNTQIHLGQKVMMQAGVRYNMFLLDAQFDTTFYPFPFTEANLSNAATTGSLGFSYRPTEKWAFSTNASTGFRSPNVDDIGKVFDSEPGAVVVPNPDLEAEYAYNIDFGIAKVFGNSVKVDATAFYTLLDNALVRRDFTLNGQDSIIYDGDLSQVQAIQNAAVANVYGIQAGFEIKLASGFSFSSRFNYQVGEEELDDGTTSPSRHAAPWFGTARLTYSKNKVNVQFYGVYSDKKVFDDLPESEKSKTEIYAIDKNGDPYSPSWYTLNFKAMYKISDHFTANAGLENITDQRYRPYSSGIVAPGRNFIISLRANF
ncbi:MAG: TonB-dependent receptor [Vicingus serpentipes]|nr:TonB-dependent receptor [Vicingus serpentipes]